MKKRLAPGIACLLVLLMVIPAFSNTDDDDKEISIADSRTFVTFYKREKKFKALVELLKEELKEIESLCAGDNPKSCDLEGKLYILDDLAEVYTYGLVDFEKAREYNEKTRFLCERIRKDGINTLPVSDYFNANRFLYYSFYADEGPLGGKESMDFAFDDAYVENVRKSDFGNVVGRVARRHAFLGEKLGTVLPARDASAAVGRINADLFLLYTAFIDASPAYSSFEKGFLKARLAAQALSEDQPDKKVFIDAILSARAFGEECESCSLERQDKINQLNYWLTLAFLERGQFKEALEHHDQFVAGITALEKATLDRYQTTSKMLNDQFQSELSETNSRRYSQKKALASLAEFGVVAFKTLISTAALAGDVTLMVLAKGQVREAPLTGLAHKVLWENKQADWGAKQAVLNSQYLRPVHSTGDNSSKIFDRFMAPYALLLNRYLNKYELAVYMLAIGDAYAAEGTLDKAAAQYEVAIDIVERQRLTIYSEKERVAYFGFKQALYEKMIQALIRLDKVDEALTYVERSKSRAFLDVLGGGGIKLKSSNQTDLAHDYYQSRAEVDSVLETTGIGADQLVYTKEKSLRGLEVVENKLDDNSYDEIFSLSGVKVLETPKIQALIDSDTAILEYYFTKDTLNIFVVRRDGVTNTSVDVHYEELVGKIGELRKSVVELRYDRNLARDLFNILIQPVQGQLGCDRLVIIPHRGLHYLPFQALLDGNRYLIEEFAISYVPSATALSIVNKKRFAKKGKALIVGNPTGDLAYSEIEAADIGKVLPDAVVLLGDKGTETLLKKDAGDYKVIHVASHGFFDPRQPLASMIKLHPTDEDDGRLMTDELFSCRWRASLVTLSACQTGISKYSSGDELIGLQRGVFFAGTQSLLASSWQVGDKSTSYLMAQFYKYLGTDPKDVALRKAQEDAIKRYDQPFHWASFKLIGASNRVYNPHYPLLVSSNPEDAVVALKGTRWKYEPNVKLPVGKYTVEVSREGYVTKEVEVEIVDDQASVEVALVNMSTGCEDSAGTAATRFRLKNSDEPDRPKFPFTVLAEPKDARVRFVGLGMKYKPGMMLSPGEYTVRVTKRGYVREKLTVEIGSEPFELKVKLKSK